MLSWILAAVTSSINAKENASRPFTILVVCVVSPQLCCIIMFCKGFGSAQAARPELCSFHTNIATFFSVQIKRCIKSPPFPPLLKIKLPIHSLVRVLLQTLTYTEESSSRIAPLGRDQMLHHPCRQANTSCPAGSSYCHPPCTCQCPCMFTHSQISHYTHTCTQEKNASLVSQNIIMKEHCFLLPA